MIKTLAQIVAKVKEDENLSAKITEDTNLAEDIGFDSLQMINFILMLEDSFDLEIDFETFDFALLTSTSRLASYLEGLRQDAAV